MARYALVVGISEYKSKHLKNLSKPVGDAEAISALLDKYGQFDTKPTVLKGAVTSVQLVEALQTFLEKQAVNSDAFIYFTGHGINVQDDPFGGQGNGCLATSDTEVTVESNKVTSQTKAIPFTGLNSLIQKANLSSLVMMIDACHSGDFVGKAAYEQSFSAFNEKSDCLLISACRNFEEALAKKSENHSLFTSAVLAALVAEQADSTGAITSGRLADELKLILKGSRQKPEAYGKGLGLKIIEFPPEERASSAATSKGQDGAVFTTQLPTVPRQMPPLPDHFVERPEQQQQVKADLLCEGTKAGTLVVSAIYGLGGIGKSVLAAKLARDADIQSHFSDGILWATLGQNPDILPLLSGWIQALGDNDYKPTATESASNHLRTLLYDRHVLLVVDDVWNPEHLEPFRVGGEGSCVLVTTREARISGAHLHQLDVMSPEQSLELMTQKLSEPLSDSARQQALSFAERVGHLPLALELAASQIEDGVTWRELVADFQSEIVRLETLDVYGQTEMPDEEKRRKYSLLACFNLSLKQLSLEQLRQFAWLGVVPEDVSLTQEMAETLWQVTSRQAGLILRIFRPKSLVLQGAKQADERPSYRMHDRMHDLAQQLLRSPPQPLSEGELPGLGLTKAEAHNQLLEHYRKKTQKGQWHTLKDDGYIYAYLTWHMEQAKQSESIHQLLQSSNEEGRNGWYEACDAIGKPVGFVNDVGRAWQRASATYERTPNESVEHLFHYAFIRASLNSLASKVPVALIEALVKKGVWQSAQGLAYAQQVQNPWQRAECISVIVHYLPKALLPEVLKTIGQIKDAAYRSYVLSKLAERFPEVWPEVLAAIKQIQDRYGQHREQTPGFSHRALALSRVIEQLPEQYVSQAMDITRQIQQVSDRAMALNVLIKKRVDLLPEALEATRQIQSEYYRSSALSALAAHLPAELLPEALEATRQIQSEDSRSSALSALAAHLPAELLPEALEATRQIQDEDYRSSALSALAAHLPEVWPEALEATRQIQSESSRSSALRELAAHLPEVWPEALEATRQIQDEDYRSSALSALAAYLPAELLPEALEATRQIQSEYSRSSALSALAAHLPAELLPEALEATRQIQSEYSRSSALSALAAHLPAELLPEALEATRQIQSEYSRSSALSALAAHLPEVWPEALEATRQIQSEYYRSSALSALAAHLPEVWPEALEATRQIQDEDYRSSALRELAAHLPAELLPEALEATRQIQDEDYRSSALRELAAHLPAELLPEALEATRQIQDESYRSSALRELAAHLPAELLPEALEATRQIQDESYRSRALRELAAHLPAELLPEALEATRQIQDESYRSRALRELAEYLPAALLPEALEMTYQIKDQYFCANALQGLLPYLSNLFISFDDWVKILDTLAYQNRDQLLSVLPVSRSITIQFSDRDTVLKILQSVREVCEQWP